MQLRSFVLLIPALLLIAALLYGAIGSNDEKTVTKIKTCALCHKDVAHTFSSNPHHTSASGCVGCHKDARAHLENPGETTTLNFDENTSPSTINKTCLKCHGTAIDAFHRSSHARSGLACTSCHNIHHGKPGNALLAGKDKSQTCRTCHQDIFSRFNMNRRHRLNDASLSCVSCHDPHKPQHFRGLSKAKDQKCFTCHADKQGPFLHEHGSVLIEGCQTCHEPHGSTNKHLLRFSTTANLCYSCHTTVPGFHTFFSRNTNCTSCHTAIHGSHLSPFFLE